MNGLKMVLKGALEFGKGDEIIGFGDSGKVGTEIIPDFMRTWHDKRIKLKIRLRTIFNNTPEAKAMMKKSAKMRLREARIMPIMFGSQMGIWVCRDRSIIWLLAEDPIAIMIRNREISDEFRNFFNVLWKHAD